MLKPKPKKPHFTLIPLHTTSTTPDTSAKNLNHPTSGNNPTLIFQPSELLIEKLRDFPALTTDQLLFIGQANLTYLQHQWQYLLAKDQPLLDLLQKRCELLANKTVTDLQRLATQYECPDYPTKMSTYRSGEKALNTDDPKAQERKAGTTTFNICGWCEHAVGEGFPYSPGSTTGGQRIFLPSCGFQDVEWHYDHVHDFNHPCSLTHCHNSTLNVVRDELQIQYHLHQKLRQIVQQRIASLQSLIDQAEPKPIFPICRTLKHYTEGTRIFFLDSTHTDKAINEVPSPFRPRLINSRLYIKRGTVVGYTDQWVTDYIRVKLDGATPGHEIIEAQHDLSNMISEEEWHYLVEHPDYAQIWITTTSTDQALLTEMLEFYRQHQHFPGETV